MHSYLLLPLFVFGVVVKAQEFYPLDNNTESIGPEYDINSSVAARSVFPNALSGNKGFQFFWNIPSFMCRSHGVQFNDLSSRYGIIQNENDTFRGDKLVILYDPGKFPALLEHTKTKQIFRRNGGVPQEGNLQEHLQIFTEHINQLIPDANFAGIGVIDFESWRPIFRQNSGVLQPYKNLSIKLVRQEHRAWPKERVLSEARRRFETAGRRFVEETIKLAQKLRPQASWGYYGFPYCFNLNGGANKDENCPPAVKRENDEINWLWNTVDIVLPSVYLNTRINPAERVKFVRGRMREAFRIAQKSRKRVKPPVVGYIRYVYTNQPKDFLTDDDMRNSIEVMKQQNADGVVLWGSSFDLKTKAKCEEFRHYVNDHMGPIISNSNSFRQTPTVIGSRVYDYL